MAPGEPDHRAPPWSWRSRWRRPFQVGKERGSRSTRSGPTSHGRPFGSLVTMNVDTAFGVLGQDHPTAAGTGTSGAAVGAPMRWLWGEQVLGSPAVAPRRPRHRPVVAERVQVGQRWEGRMTLVSFSATDSHPGGEGKWFGEGARLIRLSRYQRRDVWRRRRVRGELAVGRRRA